MPLHSSHQEDSDGIKFVLIYLLDIQIGRLKSFPIK